MSGFETTVAALLVGTLLLTALAVLWLLPARRLPRPDAVGPEREHASASRGGGVTGAAAVSAGVLVELVAAMLESGVPVSRALDVLARTDAGEVGASLRIVAAALGLGLSWQQAWSAAGEVPPQVQDLRSALTFSAVSGAPSASALRAASAQVRRAEHRRAEAAAERLSVHLMVPLGLCSLPAFVCWGIVPVLIGLVPDLLG